jgi:hypothetical protein
MRGRSPRQTIRLALFRLGLQTSTKEVVRLLAEEGIGVSAELVRLVKIELLRELPDRPRPAAPPPRPVAKWRSAATRRPPRRGG